MRMAAVKGNVQTMREGKSGKEDRQAGATVIYNRSTVLDECCHLQAPQVPYPVFIPTCGRPEKARSECSDEIDNWY